MLVQAFKLSFILCVFTLYILVMDVVNNIFEGEIEPSNGDVKFADVWPIENIWMIIREKTRRKTFETLDSLASFRIVKKLHLRNV